MIVTRRMMQATCTLTLLALAGLAMAAGEAASQPAIEIKTLKEPIKLLGADPTVVIEDKYVAIVRGVGGSISDDSFNQILSLPANMPPSEDLRRVLMSQYGTEVFRYADGRLVPNPGAPARYGMGWGPGFAAAGSPMSSAPGTGRPPAGGGPTAAAPPKPVIEEYRITAPTPEKAKELAGALLAALDSRCTWIRGRQMEDLKRVLTERTDCAMQLDRRQDQQSVILKGLQSREEIPPKVYEEISAKDWLQRIEIAGIRAKVDAAQKALNALPPDKSTPEKRAKFEEIITSWQIDLASLIAQQKTIQEFRQSYVEQLQYRRQLDNLQPEISALQARKNELQAAFDAQRNLLAALTPFERTGPVEIHPIQWIKPEPPKTPAAGTPGGMPAGAGMPGGASPTVPPPGDGAPAGGPPPG